MAKLFTELILTIRIATIYNKLQNINKTLKLHKSVPTIGFIKNKLHYKVSAKFVQINGQDINKQYQIDAE